MIRLRQIALVAHDLESVLGDLDKVLGLEVAFRDPGVAAFGLVNAVLPVGEQFIEVVRDERDLSQSDHLKFGSRFSMNARNASAVSADDAIFRWRSASYCTKSANPSRSATT